MTDVDNRLYGGPAHQNPAPQNPGTISSGLLGNVRTRGADAWRRMARLYAPLVYYWCLRAGLQSNDAEDVVQEVFCTVAARIGDFRRDRQRGSFRGWLRTITRHKLGDFMRAQGKGPKVQGGSQGMRQFAEVAAQEQPADHESDDLSAETRLLYSRVLDLIRSEFEEPTWRACLRVVVDGVSPKAVAEELGMSANSVYLAKSRVLRRVRDELSEDILP